MNGSENNSLTPIEDSSDSFLVERERERRRKRKNTKPILLCQRKATEIAGGLFVPDRCSEQPKEDTMTKNLILMSTTRSSPTEETRIKELDSFVDDGGTK